MQSQLSHLQLNVNRANLPFYKDLLTFMGWQPIHEDEAMLGIGNTGPTSLWFVDTAKDTANDYDGPGMNHLSLGAESQADVDLAVTYLTERGVERLFETPRHRPEFAQGDDQTYYQVMFESPDRLLIEVVYTGPKTA